MLFAALVCLSWLLRFHGFAVTHLGAVRDYVVFFLSDLIPSLQAVDSETLDLLQAF